ncbi:MAG TPA: alpha-glucuronidase family glycosyl hydrolase [Sphingomicrobium sp.]
MFDSASPFKITTAALVLLAATPARVDDGYRLWLRYDPVEEPIRQQYAMHATELVVDARGPMTKAAASELKRGLSGLLARPIDLRSKIDRDGAILLALAGSSALKPLKLRLRDLGNEGFLIRSEHVGGHAVTVITANDERGLLYGAFALLRQVQTHRPLGRLLSDRPALPLRLLDHWDNLDGFIERGYAGRSLWNWRSLPQRIDQRYVDYARADASVGINGAVLNNVNANAQILTPVYLRKVRALADTFRPWGVRVYLSAKFTAPIEIGGLKTADPLDPAVRAWWRAKADEIYRSIPDFGGFLVKANSEGQPGPQDYHRTHADGANMLAEALRPHGGIVIWRAFVYSSSDQDRAKQAYDEFRPLDGKFARNVIVQVKNGPVDFQPREPFSPLFGAMPHTRLAMEVQITKEYLGFNTHVAYLGTMWEEALKSRTARPNPNSIVADSLSAMAGVANTGTDRNWSGSQFDQANWYAFGRLAWNPRGSARSIADEWTRMTWGNDLHLVATVVGMMMGSRQAVVNYMTPLGLAHQMGTGHHYGPAPWVTDQKRPEWNPTYYNRADSKGIGFDRTASGTNAVAQYAPAVAARFAKLNTVGDDYLLWFHHVPWEMRLDTGRTVWDELLTRYDLGVAEVAGMNRDWQSLRPFVDPRRFTEVSQSLATQGREAKWWRDASIAYFQSISRRPLPAGVAPPEHSLDYYKSLEFPNAPGWAH